MHLPHRRPNQARHRTRPSAYRSICFGNSRVHFTLPRRCRAGSVRLDRSGKVGSTMTTVRNPGYLSRPFASLRLGVFALNHRAVPAEQRDELAHGGRGCDVGTSDDSELSLLTQRRRNAKAQREFPWTARSRRLRPIRIPNQTLETNADSASLRRHRSAFRSA